MFFICDLRNAENGVISRFIQMNISYEIAEEFLYKIVGIVLLRCEFQLKAKSLTWKALFESFKGSENFLGARENLNVREIHCKIRLCRNTLKNYPKNFLKLLRPATMLEKLRHRCSSLNFATTFL